MVKWLVTVIQAYAPTNVSTDVEKFEFYNYLQKTPGKITRHVIKLLIGDFNAQIDNNREEQEFYDWPTRFKEYVNW